MAERIIRVVGSLAIVGMFAAAVWWVGSQTEHEAGRRRPGPDLPGGPRYTLASGRFDRDRWGDYAGKQWRLVVWGNEVTHCFRLEIGDPQGRHGLSCSTRTPRSNRSNEHVLARMFDPGGGNGGKIRSIAVGALSEEVARLAFVLRKGDTSEVLEAEPLRAPAATGLDERFYVVFLPPAPGRIVAYDASGRVLDTKPLCDRDCQGYLAAAG